MVRVSVQDQGPGVADEHKQKIFDKFTQIDSSTRREKGGTGLGLAISSALIRLHQGRIGVRDNQPHGADFFFELPIEQAGSVTD
jgi:signal transduction histidine kinase